MSRWCRYSDTNGTSMKRLGAVGGLLRLRGRVGRVTPGAGGADDLGLGHLDDEVPGQADRGPDDEHVRQGLERADERREDVVRYGRRYPVDVEHERHRDRADDAD